MTAGIYRQSIEKIFFTCPIFAAIRSPKQTHDQGTPNMAEKEHVALDDDFLVEEDADEAGAAPETARTNLTRRRIIDNLLEERRLKKQLADYDFAL